MTKKAPSEWNLHVKSVFAKGRADNKDYKFKEALKDAAKTWNGSSSSEVKGKKYHKKQKGGDSDSKSESTNDMQDGGEDSSSTMSGSDSTPVVGGKKSKKTKKATKKTRKSRKGKKSGKKSRKSKK